MATKVELYEALKVHLGTEAARMVAEAIPLETQFATKTDVVELEHKMEAMGARLEQRITQVQADLSRQMLMFFVPLWIGVYGTIAAIVIGFATGR